MNKTGIHAGHADHAAASDRRDTLSQRFAAAAFQFKVRQHRLRQAAFRFKAYGINYRVHAAVSCRLLDDFFRRIVLIIEVDRYRAVTFFGETQAPGVVINDEDLLRAQQSRTGDSQ
ncbi:Uncharacterised protein [Acinetobacter baumannii]|nr:Uncharacterised protein [Acinetobacter baumannii]